MTPFLINEILVVKNDDSFPITYVGGYFPNSRLAKNIVLFAHNDTISINRFDETDNPNLNAETLKFSKMLVLCFDLLIFEDILLLAVGLTNGNVEIFYTNKVLFFYEIFFIMFFFSKKLNLFVV